MKKVLLGVLIILVIFSLAIFGFYIKNINDNADVAISSDENTVVPTNSGDLSGNGQSKNTVDSSDSMDGIPVNDIPKENADKSSELVSEGTDKDAKEAAKKEEEEKKNKTIVEKILPDKVEDKIDAIAAGNVSASDLLEVIKIIGGKLSIDEITYLFNSAKAEYWETTSVEDIEKTRELLFSKLSDDDLAKLSAFGKKYGRSMKIIDKDIDVAATKENQMRAKGLID